MAAERERTSTPQARRADRSRAADAEGRRQRRGGADDRPPRRRSRSSAAGRTARATRARVGTGTTRSCSTRSSARACCAPRSPRRQRALLRSGVLSGAGRTLRRPAHGSCRNPPPPSPHHRPRQPRAGRRAWRSTTRRPSSSCARGWRRATTPRAVVADAIEIGARVLNREQTGANVEFVKAELEKTARESQAEFAERSRAVAEVLRPQVRRGVRAGDRARRAGAHEALRRRVVGGGAEPAQGRARRGDGRDAGRPAQAVHGRLGRQPVRGLPARLAGRDEADVRPAARAPARDERADAGPRRWSSSARGRRRRRPRPSRRRPSAAPPRAARSRRPCTPRSTRSRSARATTATRSATSRAAPARPATSWWRSRAAPARRAAASCSRPRPRGCRSRRRSRSSTARAPSARPTSPCSSCPTRSGSRPRCTSCASTAGTSSWPASTPRRARRSRSRSPTRWPGRGC